MHTFLRSSTLKSADYDAETQTLTVTFKNGGTYRYAEVPALAFQELTQAESAGHYFHAKVRSTYSAAQVKDTTHARDIPG